MSLVKGIDIFDKKHEGEENFEMDLIQNFVFEEKEEGWEQLFNMKPERWFVKFEDSKPDKLGAIYYDITLDTVEMAIAENENSLLENFINSYYQKGRSFLEFTFGLRTIYRKFVV